jgi:tetratricopeptide (TPR) repeat protein
MSTGKTKGKAVESPKKNALKSLGGTATSPKMKSKARVASAGNNSKGPAKFPERKLTADEIAHKQALERFTSALELMNQGQFNRAKGLFERLVENPSREIGERSKVYLNICTQRSAKPAVQLKTVDDIYDYAVSLANEGFPEQAEEHLRKALKLSPKADFLYYALAATFALRNDVEGTLEYLDKAIQLDQRNRYQAQNDPDFENLLEDPRFTELIYPERPLN